MGLFVALRYDLTLKDVTLLLYLSQTTTLRSRKELADFTGMSRNSLSMSLQKLTSRNYIRITEIKEHKEKSLRIELLPAAQELLPVLSTVQSDFDNARFADFTEEELVEYARLSEKVNENTRRILMN